MKYWAIITICAILLLSACSPRAVLNTPATDEETPSNLSSEEAATSAANLLITPTNAPTALPVLEFTASPSAECWAAPILPALNAMEENQIPPITTEDWSYGAMAPVITILTYCSYQKSSCSQLLSNLSELQDAYKQELRVVYRHYPQAEVDDKALVAAQAAEAAGLQNRFWEMSDLLFTRQSEWVPLPVNDFPTWLADQVSSLGISAAQFSADLQSEAVRLRVDDMVAGASPLGLVDTPVLFYNGVLVKSGVDFDSLESMVKYFLLPDKSFSSCPEMTIDPDRQYTATFKTEKGDIVFELYPRQAPWAVNSFVFLARSGWYDTSGFFRVVPGFVVQGGDPSNSGLGSPGYNFSNEVDPSLRFDKPGVLAMTNQGADTNGSQFFITYAPVPLFDGSYTIFGQVVEGIEVLQSLRPRSPESDQILLPPDMLLSIEIEESQ